MFGSIGVPELILIFILALLLFGPRKLPDIGKNLGRAMGEFRRASNDLRRSLEEEVAAEELKATGREVKAAADEMTRGEVSEPPRSAKTATGGDGPAAPGGGEPR